MGSLFCVWVFRDMVKYNSVEFIISNQSCNEVPLYSCGDTRVVILGDCFDTEVLVWVKKATSWCLHKELLPEQKIWFSCLKLALEASLVGCLCFCCFLLNIHRGFALAAACWGFSFERYQNAFLKYWYWIRRKSRFWRWMCCRMTRMITQTTMLFVVGLLQNPTPRVNHCNGVTCALVQGWY